jgi:DNA-binding response OmpR family regulator
MNHHNDAVSQVTFAPTQGEQSPGVLSVLVVEDHLDIAETLAKLLRMRGYKVRVALDGLTASQAAEEVLPDVVLLDIGLPGIDGYEVARRIKKQTHEKRPLFIAVTGLGQESDRRQSEEAGIDLHLVKPVDPGQLLGLLNRFEAIIM